MLRNFCESGPLVYFSAISWQKNSYFLLFCSERVFFLWTWQDTDINRGEIIICWISNSESSQVFWNYHINIPNNSDQTISTDIFNVGTWKFRKWIVILLSSANNFKLQFINFYFVIFYYFYWAIVLTTRHLLRIVA